MNEQKESNLETIIFSFIWSFKKGDNILYNLNILNELYDSKRRSTNNKKLFYNKPIILILAAIIECILEDFIWRIKEHTHEKIPNLSENVVRDFKYIDKEGHIEIRELKKFYHFIDQLEKHKIFGDLVWIYRAMNLVRKLRNRLHIQNSHDDLGKNESSVFTESNLEITERLLELIIRKMAYVHPRNGMVPAIDPGTINFPWK